MEKPYVVGMDIGGTNTVFGIVDQRGNVLATDSVKTQSYAKIEDYVEAVTSKLLPLIESVGGVEKIKGMGVGAPNGNYYNGTIEFAPNLPWRGVIPLAALFEEKIGIPTALTNDANAAAIGEMTYGAARGMKDFIMITLGTGVGSGIVRSPSSQHHGPDHNIHPFHIRPSARDWSSSDAPLSLDVRLRYNHIETDTSLMFLTKANIPNSLLFYLSL